MEYCKKCGSELPEDSIFCTKCGEKKDISKVSNDIRCIKCGNVIEGGGEFCKSCGERTITEDEYQEKMYKWNMYKKLQFVYTTFYYSTRILPISIIAIVLLLIVDVATGKNISAISGISIFLLSVIIFLLPFLIIIAILRLIFKLKFNMSYNDFKALANEVKLQPNLFYKKIIKPIVKTKPQEKTKEDNNNVNIKNIKDKYTKSQIIKQRLGAILGLTAVVAVATLAILGQIDIDKNISKSNNKNSSQSNTSSNSSTSTKQLSGRWESTNGQTAMIFKGSTVYVGNKYNNDSDIIAECKNWNKGIATYSISGNKITFKYKTATYTYNFDGTTIYADNEKIKKEQ